jgi:hypothetical protein
MTEINFLVIKFRHYIISTQKYKIRLLNHIFDIRFQFDIQFLYKPSN